MCNGALDFVIKGKKGFEALGIFVTEMDKELAWYTGLDFRGYALTVKEETAVLTVKATRGETAVVSFFTSPTPLGCFRIFYASLRHNRISWQVDKFYK